jgi:membrane-associated phospholipid phosphatase
LVPVLIVGLTLAGSGGLTFVLKAALSRPRPPLHDALARADGYAFPSAHAATAAAAFGVLAYLVALRVRRWKVQVTVWAGAATLTTLVGISRIYLGVHWTTDVLGGWAFGLLWLTIVVSACRRRLVHRDTQAGGCRAAGKRRCDRGRLPSRPRPRA